MCGATTKKARNQKWVGINPSQEQALCENTLCNSAVEAESAVCRPFPDQSDLLELQSESPIILRVAL